MKNKKPSIGESLAGKAFDSEAFRKSWQVHLQAFGPILAPAFAEDAEARVLLTSALNKISRRDIDGGVDELEAIEARLVSDADRAAWNFFMGVASEMEGDHEEMMSYYQAANSYRHRFYLPYLKVAKQAHTGAAFDIAEKNYREALRCLSSDDRGSTLEGMMFIDGTESVAAAICNNLVSCLTMMHRYDDAERELRAAASLPYLRGGRCTRAILYAARRDNDALAAMLDEIKHQEAELYQPTREMTDRILLGQHPHFCRLTVDPRPLCDFWARFLSESDKLRIMLEQGKGDAVLTALRSYLTPVAPFQKRAPGVSYEIGRDGIAVITLRDYYCLSLREVYEKLISSRPTVIDTVWRFELER